MPANHLVFEFPTSWGGQQPIRSPDSFHFWPHSAHIVTPSNAKMMRKKAHLVLRMLELRIGQTLLILVGVLSNSLRQIIHSSDFCIHQGFNKQLSLAGHLAKRRSRDTKPTNGMPCWYRLPPLPRLFSL
jgi:hypothetical protein